jgi:hypothetical protein
VENCGLPWVDIGYLIVEQQFTVMDSGEAAVIAGFPTPL